MLLTTSQPNIIRSEYFIIMYQETNNNGHPHHQFEQQPEEEKFTNHEEGHLTRLCVDYFEKYACTQFAPLRQFFNLQHCAQMVKSQPSFQPTISKSLRDNLKIQRQIQYLKGSLHQQYIQSTIQQQLTSEVRYQPIKRRGNLLVPYKDKVYWCYETKLKCLQVGSAVKCQKYAEKGLPKGESKKDSWQVTLQQPKDLLNLEQHIFELKRSKNLLIMRAARKLFFYDLHSQKLVDIQSFKLQILTFWVDPLSQQVVYLSLVDGEHTVIQVINIGKNTYSAQSFITTSQVHTAWNVHKNWAVACSYNSVLSLDFRAKSINQLRQSPENCRIFGGTSLNSKVFSENNFITSESFDAKIFDLRKTNNFLTKINHFCEEAPPTILSIFDSEADIPEDSPNKKELLLSRLEGKLEETNILLVATNPYVFGSSLLTEISPEMCQQKIYERSKQVNSFQLLFDKGKLQKGYHPLSTTLVHVENQLSFFHLDNLGGLSVQLFQRQKTIQKHNKEMDCKWRRFQFSKECGFDQIRHPNQDWLIKHRLDTYLKQEKQSYWDHQLGEDSMDLELIGDTFKTKYLRYSDLKKFYSQLALQKQEDLSKALQQEQKELQKFRPSKEKDLQSAFQTLQSTFAASQQINTNRPLFSSTLLEELSKDWQQSYSKI